MNVYLVDAGEQRYVEEYIDVWARYETGRFVELIAAETRGKARAIAVKHWGRDFHCEWTDIKSVRKVMTGDYPVGVIGDNEELWDKALEIVGHPYSQDDLPIDSEEATDVSK